MTKKDKDLLRSLAGRYAEIAHGKTMAERREKWRLHNGLKEKTFPFSPQTKQVYPPRGITEKLLLVP